MALVRIERACKGAYTTTWLDVGGGFTASDGYRRRGGHAEWGEAMRRNGRVRGSLLVLLVVVALVSAACILPGDGDVSDRCKCPNLEAVAPTIDWVGHGEAPVTLLLRSGRDGFRHRVNLHYASSEPLVDTAIAVQRLSEAGFQRSDDSDQSFRGEEWLVILGPGGTDERPLVILFVEITDDERAEEILQPLVDALGTVP